MSLSGIISVSGLPGLHKVLSQTKNGLIVESISDNRRRPIYSTQKVSSLEDISIYTIEDDIPLVDVFKKMSDKEGGKEGPSHKSEPQELRDYLTGIIEDVDHDKVYNSDIAKLFQWYNMLVKNDLLNFDEEEAEEEKKEEVAEEKKESKKAATKKTAKKPAAKKSTEEKSKS